MPWVRVSDDFYDHRKFADVTAFGVGAWIIGLAYCNRNRTDGVIPSRTAERLVNPGDLAVVRGMGGRDAEGEDAVSELLDADLWHEDDHDCPDCQQPGPGRYVIHGYADYQPTAEEIDRRHEEKSEAGRKGAQSRWSKAGATARAMAPPMAPAMAPPMADGWQNDAPNPKPNTNPTARTTTSVSRTQADPEFDSFWAQYPRKVGKAAARKAYAKAVRSVSAEVLLAGAQRYAQERAGQDVTFTAHPSSWLNDGRWEDEPALPSSALASTASRRLNPAEQRHAANLALVAKFEAEEAG